MNLRKRLILPLIVYSLFAFACRYIVLPEGLGAPEVAEDTRLKWSAFITDVSDLGDGSLHIDLAIRNDTGDWSEMNAVEGKSAVLTTSDGKKVNCDNVYVGTGGHRLAPGFQTRGYTVGEGAEAETQLLYVECKDAVSSPGSTLSIEYVSFRGNRDYYDQEAGQAEGELELNLDEVVQEATYPVGTAVEGTIIESTSEIIALSDNVITLFDTQRSETGFEFTWQNFNPSKFPLQTHIGIPPVIGSDGIIYGVFETLDLSSVPITPANDKVQWATEVTVPQDIQGFYILLSVESKKPRTYVNYAVDIHDK
jgi:hypothetical protein